MRIVKHVGAVVGVALLLAAGFATAGLRPAIGGNEDNITICHAAGQEGTTHFVTLTISPNAVFGPGGHFNEDGTPQAGHEQDYMGPCRTDTTTTTTTTEPPTTTTTTETTTTTTTTTTEPPGGPRCPPGQEPTAGKDGEPGNQECEFPPTQTTTTTSPPPTTTSPPTETAPTETTPTAPVPTTAEPTSTVSEDPPLVVAKPKPKHAKPKPPPLCPVAKPTTGPCAVQGSG